MSTKKEETHDIAKKIGWTVEKDFPLEGNNALYLTTIKGSYLLEGETPNQAYRRISSRAATLLNKPELEDQFYNMFQKLWLIPSTPVMANFGTDLALPISCFSSHIGDNMYDIYRKNLEMALLSKYGGGTAYDFSGIRPLGAKIKDGRGGTSDGIIPFIKSFDSTIIASKQGKTRRGAAAIYLNAEHSEYLDFLEIREPKGDINRQCHNIHQGAIFTDEFMNKVVEKNGKEREIWLETIKKRVKTGEPYCMFIDNANNAVPEWWKENDLKIRHSNLCVTGDQFVVTDKGIKTVLELYQSKENLVLFDGTKPITASPMKLVEKNVPVYEIKTKWGRSHKVTDYHKVMTDKGLVECKNLNIGDKIKIQLNEGLFGNNHNPELAFLLGLHQADGTQTDKIITIDIWENDFKLKEEIEESIELIYNENNWNTYSVSNQFSRNVGIRKATIPKFFSQNTSDSKVKKSRLTSSKLKEFGFVKGEIPKWLLESDKETQSQYLRGLFIADGTVNIGKSKGNPVYLSITQINKEFLQQIQIMLNNLGINAKLHKHRDAGLRELPNHKGGYSLYNCKDSWRLIISNKPDALKFEKLTGFLTYKNVILEDREYRDNIKKYDEVESIELIGNEDVYCTTVNTDEHVWVCNSIITSNCNEIYLPTDENHTLVCCLSSLNLSKFEEWKDTNTVFLSILFLDAVIEDFIQKTETSDYKGIEDATRFAKKSRALGLGTLGWHSFLQSKMIPFIGIQANSWTNIIFNHIKEKSEEATLYLGQEYGEPEWCKGTGRRNLTLLAIAPNRSSSKLAGGMSQGVEPLAANLYMDDDAKGMHIRRNPYLEQLLESKGKNLPQVWDVISEDKGSVMNVKCLSKEEKEVFKTFKEINQLELVRQACIRQKYIDQGQSINLAFYQDAPAKFINQVHLEAWKGGLKGLYYFRSESVLRADTKDQRDLYSECLMCEG